MKTFRNFREKLLEYTHADKFRIDLKRKVDPNNSREKGLEASIDDLERITGKYKKPQRPTPTQGHTNAQTHDEVKGNEFRTNAPSPRTKVLGGNQNASDIKRRNRYSDAEQNIARARNNIR